MKKSLSLEKSIQFLLEYCKNNNLEVLFRKNVQDRITFKKIYINNSASKKTQYYTLIHEIGHFLCYKNIFYVYPKDKTKKGYSTLSYKILKVQEEFDAWDEGHFFIQDNNLFIDKDYDVIKAKSLSSYMIWATKKIIKRTYCKQTVK